MHSRRGEIFFWIAQVLLLPALLCFGATATLQAGNRAPVLLKVGSAMALLQIPCTAMAFLLGFAAGIGGILPKPRIRVMYVEVAFAVLLIAAVFLMRDVYRPQ